MVEYIKSVDELREVRSFVILQKDFLNSEMNIKFGIDH